MPSLSNKRYLYVATVFALSFKCFAMCCMSCPCASISATSSSRVDSASNGDAVPPSRAPSASSSANTTAARNASVGVGVQAQRHGYSGSITTANQSDGGGRTAREGQVLAQLTVSVKDIMANGDLVIAGEQMVDINNERQRITVEGRVRPQDISETNVVMSTRIANARISYAGQGDMADRQRPAWWQRFLSLFGV